MSVESTWTYAAVDQVTIAQSGTTLTGSLRYEIYNVTNPGGEIDQLFLAADRYVIATIYGGHPGGCPGQKATWTASDASLAGLPNGTYTLYAVRTAATSVDAGINHYENENGGWRVAIGSVTISSPPPPPPDDLCPLASLAVVAASFAGIVAVRPHRRTVTRKQAAGDPSS